MALTSARLESKAARATFEEVAVEVSYFALDMAADFMNHDLAVRGGMVVIRRPFHRFFSQCIEAAGAGRSVLLFVAALPVEGPIRLFCGRRCICSRRSTFVGPLSGHG